MIKNKIKLLLLLLILLSSCQAVKDGLTGKKNENSDEFLVQKKNPLVLPPDYSKLPLPKNIEKNKESIQSFDLEKKLKQNSNTIKKDSSQKITGSFEKTIIEKIKKD